MSPHIVALADDLTGAAEIAALGARCGRRAIVTTDAENARIPGADLVVIDTDTRLELPPAAARRAAAAARSAPAATATLLFKKTDSVLRGPVRAELEAIAAARNFVRVLLIPANPALGRIVEHGHYFVNGRSLVETAFAHDPHHPARSDDVTLLLGPGGGLPVQSVAVEGPLPPMGIVIGDATSMEDLARWAQRTDAATLPAGAAGFFAALLQKHDWVPQAFPTPPPARGPILVIRGTKHPARGETDRASAPAPAFVPEPELIVDPRSNARENWFATIATALRENGFASVSAARVVVTDPDASSKIRQLFAELVAALHGQQAFTHLVIEGGATASSIVRHVGWTQLAVAHEWAQGVVTLEPVPDHGVDLTIKPGSYLWPEAFGKLRLDARRLSARDPKA